MLPPNARGLPGPMGFQGVPGPPGLGNGVLITPGRLDTDQTLNGDDSYAFPVLLETPFTLTNAASRLVVSGVFNGYTDPAILPGVGLVELALMIDAVDPFADGVWGGSFIYFDGTADKIHGVNADFQADITGQFGIGPHVARVCWLYYTDPGIGGFLRCNPVSGPFANQCTLQILEVTP